MEMVVMEVVVVMVVMATCQVIEEVCGQWVRGQVRCTVPPTSTVTFSLMWEPEQGGEAWGGGGEEGRKPEPAPVRW